MHPEFFEGFTIYRRGDGPVFVTPHSGPALETPTNRDDNSDTVASLCWLKTGGSLVLSNVSRKRLLGIDFNRTVPSMKRALRMYNEFLWDRNPPELFEYRQKYAFVARDERDYYERLRVHDKFWFHIKNLGNVFVFVHRKFSRLKNYPSIMDIVSFHGKGIDKDVVRKVVDGLNYEYADFFKKIDKDYRDAIMLEEKRCIETAGEMGLKDLKNPQTEKLMHLAESYGIVKKYAERRFIKRLENKFTQQNYMIAVKNAMKNAGPPLITTDTIFTSDTAYAPKERFHLKETRKDIISIEIESNQFLNYWYPNEAAEIINKLIDKVKNAEIYKILGPMQTVMIKFLGEKK